LGAGTSTSRPDTCGVSKIFNSIHNRILFCLGAGTGPSRTGTCAVSELLPLYSVLFECRYAFFKVRYVCSIEITLFQKNWVREAVPQGQIRINITCAVVILLYFFSLFRCGNKPLKSRCLTTTGTQSSVPAGTRRSGRSSRLWRPGSACGPWTRMWERTAPPAGSPCKVLAKPEATEEETTWKKGEPATTSRNPGGS